MAKLKFSEKTDGVCIHCRFTGSETLNEAEYRYFTDNRIKGWLTPRFSAPDKIEYTGAQGAPLINVLKHGVDKELYYRIVAELLTIMDTAATCGFNMPNIVLDPNFITFDTERKELWLFYLPLWYNESTNDGIVNCLRRISTYAEYKSKADFHSVDGFMNFICRADGFTVGEAMEYIRREAPDAVPAPKTAARPVSSQPSARPAAPRPAARPEFSRPEAARVTEQPRQAATQNTAQAIINEINRGSQEYLHTQEPKLPEPKVIPSLSEEKRSAVPELKKRDIPRPAVKYPTLTRRATGVTVNIDKPVFRIGKERDRVDFCVTENRTVSRLHATIYTRNGSCFVEDNNSTNRTYINGTPVLPDREIKLKSGDVLKLSDEEFDFIDG